MRITYEDSRKLGLSLLSPLKASTESCANLSVKVGLIVSQMFGLDTAFCPPIKSFPRSWNRQLSFDGIKTIVSRCQLFLVQLPFATE